jgi:hypothetical protein
MATRKYKLIRMPIHNRCTAGARFSTALHRLSVSPHTTLKNLVLCVTLSRWIGQVVLPYEEEFFVLTLGSGRRRARRKGTR